MAQLVARLVRNEKVGGSNPPSSTTGRHPIADVGFLHAWTRCCVPDFVLLVALLVFRAPEALVAAAVPSSPMGAGVPHSWARNQFRMQFPRDDFKP